MAINGRTVSLKTIVEKVYRDFKFNFTLNWSDAAEWAGELLAQFSAPIALEPKIACIKIQDYRGSLPCDLESIATVAHKSGGNTPPPNSAFSFYDKGTALANFYITDAQDREGVIILSFKEGTDVNQFGCLTPMRYATDSMSNQYHCSQSDRWVNSSYTYIVNNNHIFTNFKDGEVVMAYRAIPLDDEGFPLIPSEHKWRDGVTFQIAYKIAYMLYLQGEMDERKFHLIERDRDWYVAKLGIQQMSLDQMESFKNSWLTLVPQNYDHSNFFRNTQAPQQVYNHPLRNTNNSIW
jgi:hypothetical protein